MKRFCILTLFSIVFLLCCSLIAYLLSFQSSLSIVQNLIIGAVLIIISGLIAYFFRNNILLYYLNVVLNCVTLGFCVNAWHIFRNIDAQFWQLTLISIAPSLLMLLVFWYATLPCFNEKFDGFFWAAVIISFVGSLILVIVTNKTIISTLGLYLIMETSFLFVLCGFYKDYKEFLRGFSISAFSVVVVLIYVAVLIFSEGDSSAFLDGNIQSDKTIISPKESKNIGNF